MRSALVLLVLAATAHAQKPDLTRPPSLPPDAPWRAPVPMVRDTRLGPRIVVLPQHELPMVHVLVTVPAGSALDPANRPGVAAAVATMLEDGGTGRHTSSQIAQALAELGTELEEHVDSDQVQLSLTVLSQHLDSAIALLQELLAAPAFNADDWQRVQARR
ncbi:MAG TPA: insulinase family protein, partial [Polyangia bacterium]|nr:insulinase family protein [Polyangia bacterium]